MSEILIRPLKHGEEGEWNELCYLSYKEYAESRGMPIFADRNCYGHLYRADHRMKPENTRLLFCDGVLASSVTVYAWPVKMAGKEVIAGLVGSVATRPDYRKRGYVRMLMEDAKYFMHNIGIAVSFLYGSEKVYGSSGYAPFRDYTVFTGTSMGRVPGSISVRPLDLGRDLKKVINIYDSWNADITGPVVRVEDDWRRRVLGNRYCIGFDRFKVVERKGEIIGYGQVLDGLKISEFGAKDEDCAPDVLAALSSTEKGDFEVCFGNRKTELALEERAAGLVRGKSDYGLWLIVDGSQLGLSGKASNSELFEFLKRENFTYYKADNF